MSNHRKRFCFKKKKKKEFISNWFYLKVKFESIPPKTNDEANQDSLIRHLQSRISDLRDDNKRLRDNQQSKPILPSYHEVQ